MDACVRACRVFASSGMRGKRRIIYPGSRSRFVFIRQELWIQRRIDRQTEQLLLFIQPPHLPSRIKCPISPVVDLIR